MASTIGKPIAYSVIFYDAYTVDRPNIVTYWWLHHIDSLTSHSQYTTVDIRTVAHFVIQNVESDKRSRSSNSSATAKYMSIERMNVEWYKRGDLPAMNQDRSTLSQRVIFFHHFLVKTQERRSSRGYPMVWPSHELILNDFFICLENSISLIQLRAWKLGKLREQGRRYRPSTAPYSWIHSLISPQV